MVNSATVDTDIPVGIKGAQLTGGVIPVRINYDTTAQDLTVYTPGSDNHVGVIGAIVRQGTAGVLDLKSGSTTLASLATQANRGMEWPIGNLIVATAEGEALVIQDTQTFVGLMYLVEFNQLTIEL